MGLSYGGNRKTIAVCIMPVGTLAAAIYTIKWLADVCQDLSLSHRKIGKMTISPVVVAEALTNV